VCFTHAAPRAILSIWLNFYLRSFLQLKVTRKYDEASSLHVMKMVMIYFSQGCEGNKKGPAGDSKPLQDPGFINE
jgi:tRNA G26 N,N-dimethylase Trm1